MAHFQNGYVLHHNRAPVATYPTTIARIPYSHVMLQPPSLLQDVVTMPWDLDRYHGRTPSLLRNALFSKLKTVPNPSLPSCLFTIPLNVFELILERITKQDAFRLSQTCKSFMRHPAVMKTIFWEPISTTEIRQWYLQIPEYATDIRIMMGPPVTWGINKSTGPLVRRLAIPEWISERDLNYLTANCPNLDFVDFTEIFESVPHPVGYDTEQDSDPDSDEGEDEEAEEGIDLWPSMFGRSPVLFRNLRSVHLPYGCWKTVYSRLHRYRQRRVAHLPELLCLAEHLQSLELTCQQESTLVTSPETRREASANLLAEILNKVSRGLTALALYQSETTIDNLDRFVHSLAIFTKLRTIKISLHRDLYIYQRVSHALYELGDIVEPILSSTNRDYAHDTASVLQYLSIIKKINDRGRFSIVSSDSGESYHSLPSEYYGLSQTDLVLGPRNDLWSPVWDWNDRLNWVDHHQCDHTVETLDIGKCRALFGELIKAHIRVSVELEPRKTSSGALFACLWDEIYSHDNAFRHTYHGHAKPPPISQVLVRINRDTEQLPKQHFIKWRILNASTSIDPPPWYVRAENASPRISVEYVNAINKLNYAKYKQRSRFHPLVLATRGTSKQMTFQMKQGGKTFKSFAKPSITSGSTRKFDPKIDIPDPVWRLNEIGDLVDDLRLTWDRRFAYAKIIRIGQNSGSNTGPVEWCKLMHICYIHLRDRLWREAEYTALLFRRIPVDFPRLTRLALYIPAALYPDHDQTFINRALPGTGWTVKHHGISAVDNLPYTHVNEACLKLVDDLCPFIQRIFTRPAPTDDPSAVIVHDDEWHETKRPLFDLDGEYKSMEQLLTEPLRENYTTGGV